MQAKLFWMSSLSIKIKNKINNIHSFVSLKIKSIKNIIKQSLFFKSYTHLTEVDLSIKLSLLMHEVLYSGLYKALFGQKRGKRRGWQGRKVKGKEGREGRREEGEGASPQFRGVLKGKGGKILKNFPSPPSQPNRVDSIRISIS